MSVDASQALLRWFAVDKRRLPWRTEGGEPVPLELGRAPAAERLERLALAPLSLGAIQHLIQERLGFVPTRPGALEAAHGSGGTVPTSPDRNELQKIHTLSVVEIGEVFQEAHRVPRV